MNKDRKVMQQELKVHKDLKEILDCKDHKEKQVNKDRKVI
ncbi:unnamed protein product [marine sediment metagenome]|uniref:Uncharacterized protein n=1 Tax=marine sediment metagenome TaxID=412755 RepID=X0TY95_9ZZZZ